jgi:hypothetical protein
MLGPLPVSARCWSFDLRLVSALGLKTVLALGRMKAWKFDPMMVVVIGRKTALPIDLSSVSVLDSKTVSALDPMMAVMYYSKFALKMVWHFGSTFGQYPASGQDSILELLRVWQVALPEQVFVLPLLVHFWRRFSHRRFRNCFGNTSPVVPSTHSCDF